MKQVTIYMSPFCGHCTRALKLLKEKNAPVTEIVAAYDREKREEMLARSNGKVTYPQIFVGDVHVGGSEDLIALERAGKLDALLNDE